MTLWRIVLRRATFGLEVRDGLVVRAAPIARWTEGRPIARVVQSYWRRGAQRVDVLRLPEEEDDRGHERH